MQTYNIAVSLRFGGEDLEPAMVTSMLNISPTRAWIRGATQPDWPGELPAAKGGWELDSTLNSGSVGDHIAHVLERLGNVSGIRVEQLKASSVTLCVRVIPLGPADSRPELEWQTSPEQLSKLAQLGISIVGIVGTRSPESTRSD